jgi:hypothetical protein
LKVNEIKTKDMIKTRNKVRFWNTETLKIDHYTFQRVNEFKYLGFLVLKIVKESLK